MHMHTMYKPLSERAKSIFANHLCSRLEMSSDLQEPQHHSRSGTQFTCPMQSCSSLGIVTKIGPEVCKQLNEVLAPLFDRNPQRIFPTCTGQRSTPECQRAHVRLPSRTPMRSGQRA